MALTKVSTDGVKDDAVTTDKLANAINTERTANTAKASITINNNADNRVITGSGTANTLNGESNVVIDSSGRLLAGTTTQNNNAQLQVSTNQQVVATFEGTGSSDPQIYLGDDMSSPTDNVIILGYDKADNRGYLTVGGDADTALTINNGSLVGVNTNAPVEHFGVAGGIRLVNPTGTTRRINALPSGGYNLGTSGGSAIAFHRISDGGGGSDEIAFETHWQGNRHAESARISKFGGITFNGDTAAANALDDYEEGTFVPDFANVSNSDITVNRATYTKIGRLVHFECKFTVSSSDGSRFGFSLPVAQAGSRETVIPAISTRSGSNTAPFAFVVNANQSYAYGYELDGFGDSQTAYSTFSGDVVLVSGTYEAS